MEQAPYTAKAAIWRLDPALKGVCWLPLAGGRTNRLWRIGGFTVKKYQADAASPLFPNDAAAEARALELFAPLGIAPRLRAAGADWLVYDHAEGAVWSGDPAPVARALHVLHGARVGGGVFRSAPNGSAAVLAHARAIHALPDAPDDPGLGPVAAMPIHADAVSGNVLATPQGPLLIDWQCPALGDPAEDLCTFVSPAMTWLYSGRVLSAAEVEGFLASYPDPAVVARARAMMPVYRHRIAAHCAWKAARGDADYEDALRIELQSR
ncbi:phosphotransferase family protein [Paragemmobacter straminiformis]|uniref:Phosphotransferase n=1 Tax=Paragemmobacter straminiformis TaxID=2045119 RepID=A0A842IAG2_9RHOB|nr:phosphotransferase [Gemmobacter straminiformis]MBC2836094.1 phosphotransferase [Gemmobacter straminiformis]